MVQRHPRRTDQEWMALIQECRTSGLTDKAWCEQHHIQRSNFYYHIRRFRSMACEIPDNPMSSCPEQHEVVAIDFSGADTVAVGEQLPDRTTVSARPFVWSFLVFLWKSRIRQPAKRFETQSQRCSNCVRRTVRRSKDFYHYRPDRYAKKL